MKYLWPTGGDCPGYGVLAAPNMRGVPRGIQGGVPWACDSGCIEGPPFVKRANIEKTLAWLFGPMAKHRRRCLFVTIPDVVGDAVATYDAFLRLSPKFLGWPQAYVAQDGAENLPIPRFARVVFIGGTTEWKLGDGALSVIHTAISLDKSVHIGRVNSWKRFRAFGVVVGSDRFTCDGTRLRYERDKATRKWLSYERELLMGLL